MASSIRHSSLIFHFCFILVAIHSIENLKDLTIKFVALNNLHIMFRLFGTQKEEDHLPVEPKLPIDANNKVATFALGYPLFYFEYAYVLR